MELRSIKLSECFESPTNPRGSKFEGREFDELVASIREKGVLMPILVRAHKGKFEVIAGNRRFRAAKEAAFTEIPARIVEMTDIQAREAQIVENLQRADVHGVGHIKTICRAPECQKHWATKSPGGHYKATAEERAARKKTREAEAKRKEKEDAALATSLEKVKWPLTEKSFGVLLDLIFSRFGYAYIQPVAARHGIKAIKVKDHGHERHDLETPLRQWVDAQDNDGKLRYIFEVALEMTDKAKYLKRV